MNIEQTIGQMTNEETREMALSCMIELTDEQQIDLIVQVCLMDRGFMDEVIAALEEHIDGE